MNLLVLIFYIWNNCGRISTKHDAVPQSQIGSVSFGFHNIAWNKSLESVHHYSREYGVVGRGDMSYIFMLCSCRLNKCSISYWQSIMNFNTIKQQIEMIIMKNRWLYSLLLISIIYLVLFYFNFTAYIGDYIEEEKYGFCIHCKGSVMCGTCKCARTLLHWIVKWWWLSLLHTLWLQ